jgi:hypothetical protein
MAHGTFFLSDAPVSAYVSLSIKFDSGLLSSTQSEGMKNHFLSSTIRVILRQFQINPELDRLLIAAYS